MDGPRNHHTEWSKSDRGEISYDMLYVWNLERNDTDKFTYKTERFTDLREWTCGCGGRNGRKG